MGDTYAAAFVAKYSQDDLECEEDIGNHRCDTLDKGSKQLQDSVETCM